jgi:hypothetical protein
MPRLLCLAFVAAVATAISACPPAEEEIEIKVVAIMASEHKTTIEPKLAGFAKHAQKTNAKLTGFRVDRSNSLKLKLGETHKFELVGKEVLDVTVNKERNKDGKVVLTIKPPKLDQITYECVCDKYFSMATGHYEGKGKDREQLFIAVMAKPCQLKK